MKRHNIISYLIPAVPVVIILAPMIFSHSCANTTTPPRGGPKDTIPPVITEVEPLMGAINVSTHKTKLYLKFNEYVQVKDAKSLFLSPPLEKATKYRLKGKGVEITFENDLDTN